MRGTWTALAVIAVIATAAAQAPEETPQETPEVMPEGEGREETFYFCTACHSSLVIRRQGLSRERWDETLNWMSERHGMPVLEGTERSVILDYLAAAFPAKRTVPPSPFLSR